MIRDLMEAILSDCSHACLEYKFVTQRNRVFLLSHRISQLLLGIYREIKQSFR